MFNLIIVKCIVSNKKMYHYLLVGHERGFLARGSGQSEVDGTPHIRGSDGTGPLMLQKKKKK